MAKAQTSKVEANRGGMALARVIEERELTHEDVERELGLATKSGQVTRLISGERLPGRDLSYRAEQSYGIPMAWWMQPAPPRRGKAA